MDGSLRGLLMSSAENLERDGKKFGLITVRRPAYAHIPYRTPSATMCLNLTGSCPTFIHVSLQLLFMA